MRLALALIVVLGCDDGTNQQESDCATNERLIKHVCTQLGPDDGCVAYADVCIKLCDGLTSCSMVSNQLRPLTGWPTAPDGYCVVCLQP